MELLDPKEVPAKKRTEMINEYIYHDDFEDEDLYNEDDYNDIMRF